MKFRLFIAALAVMTVAFAGQLRADEAKLTCPVSGQPAKAAHTAEFNGGEVQFCCPNCPKAFAKVPKKFAGKANLQLVQTKQWKQAKCPLTARGMNPDKVITLAGTDISVCCGGCFAKVNKLATDDEKIDLLLANPKKGSFVAAKDDKE